MRRLAVLTSHPIPYQVPIWKSLAADPEVGLHVFFEKRLGLPDDFDPELGKKVDWGIPLLESYEHSFVGGYVSLWKELRHGQFGALLLHSWNSPMSWFAALAGRILGIKVMLRAENPLKHEHSMPAWKKELKKIILGMFFAMIDEFLYIGEGNRLFYESYGVARQKMRFAPYCVENSRFFGEKEKMPGKEVLRAKLGLPVAAVQYLSVGKLIPKKNPMDVLVAYSRMSEPNRSLVFVGDGELLPELKKYVAEKDLPNVVFAGFKSQAEIAEYYASSDVFVLASGLGETWGLVVNEAMCFELPVLVSDMVGSSEDLVEGRGTGSVFPLGNVGVLSGAMTEFLLPDKRLEAGKKSRAVIEGYGPERTVQATKESLA